MKTCVDVCMHNAPCLRVSEENRRKLDALKVHPRESYNDVIGRLLDKVYDAEPLTTDEINAIEESLQDIREGRIYSHDEVKRQLGVG
jgi:predicted transcriptional regulator